MEKSFNFKLVLLGDSSVGKSCLLVRFAKNEFKDTQEPTIGAAFTTQSIRLDDNTKVTFEVWDTAGAERFRSLVPMYYRGCAAAVIVYDISSRDSFDGAKSWIEELLRVQPTKVVIALVGNKCDLESSRIVSTELGKGFAKENDLLFYETSAKTGHQVLDLFKSIAEALPKNTKELRANTPLQVKAESDKASGGMFASCCT